MSASKICLSKWVIGSHRANYNADGDVILPTNQKKTQWLAVTLAIARTRES